MSAFSSNSSYHIARISRTDGESALKNSALKSILVFCFIDVCMFRVVGDGEDSSPRSSSKRQATESTQYPLAMKKLSQPIEPGRTRSGKSEQLSAQDSAAESDQVPGGNPYERTPGPGYNTPAVEGAQVCTHCFVFLSFLLQSIHTKMSAGSGELPYLAISS